MRRTVALAGNPNVGKSTVFNGLTGKHQHTGNWVGKTVECAWGEYAYGGVTYKVIDLPGTYSLNARSEEEEIANTCICSDEPELLVVICDATCLERGLYLLQQIEEKAACPLVLCVNLCDEAEKKGICIDFTLLEQMIGLPVVPMVARRKKRLEELKKVIWWELDGRTGEKEAEAEEEPPAPDFKIFCPRWVSTSAVTYKKKDYRRAQERADRFLTGSWTGTAVMLLLLAAVFWLTITGANYPSSWLWDRLFAVETFLAEGFLKLGAPDWLISAAVYGVYRVVAWVVSVMLPPMAIFFPLFTLLEDLGYLPRVAFNMDGAFKKCRACGKQCLTMAMGIGCNAAGVTGCRIIDSPRERLIAILTNSLVPCNGRFPTLIMLITLFFMGFGGGAAGSIATALILTGFIVAGILATLGASWLLSRTLLKGVPSSFTLELPPYRRPQVGKVIVRSICDRTLFVLARAVAVAAPAGLVIWLMANVPVGGGSLLTACASVLDPAGRLMGLDGIILMAFILGFPANEIVVPIILMAYLQTGVLVEMEDQAALFNLLAAHGWTVKTALSMAIFCLFHWPCSTTCLTIKKETGSLKWTAVAVAIPTVLGAALCVINNWVWSVLL